jgi:hypothetical protein
MRHAIIGLKKVSQNKKIDDNEDDDVISNAKIQEVNIFQDNLRRAQDQDELKKKKVCP